MSSSGNPGPGTCFPAARRLQLDRQKLAVPKIENGKVIIAMHRAIGELAVSRS